MNANHTRPIDLTTTNYGRIKETAYAYAVLPWGSTEPHNYHLPYVTDCYLAQKIAVDAVAKAWDDHDVKGMVLPCIPLGAQNPGQRELPFCIHARYDTQMLVLRDVVASLSCQGITRLVIMNGHGGNNFKSLIRDLAFDYPDMLIVNCDWFNIVPRAAYFEEVFDDHAGELETSVMLHYHPGLVDLPLAGNGACRPFHIESLNRKVGWVPRNWAHTSDDTGVGDPRSATAEKGWKYIEQVTDSIAFLLYELVEKKVYG